MTDQDKIAAALPPDWYSDRPVEFRVRLMVEQWGKLHLIQQATADALAALRAGLIANTEPGNHYQFAYQDAVSKMDVTIASLNLPAPTAKEKQ